MLNFLLQNQRIRDQRRSNRVLISVLTRFVDLSRPFRVLAMLAALAFFIFLVLLPMAQAQTYFGGASQTIDTGVDDAKVGSHTSMAIVNGFPAISYYDETNHRLMYVCATDANGTSWGTPVPVDSDGDVGQWSSLAVVNGYPAISYYDATPGAAGLNLKYVRASDPYGVSWEEPKTIDSGGNVGKYTSLAVVAGFPAISYYTESARDLKYIRAADSNGDNWTRSITVDGDGRRNMGFYTSLKVVNGNPAISYYQGEAYPEDRATDSSLKYVRALTPEGATRSEWGAPVYVVTPGAVGTYTSLAVVNGNPAISFYRGHACNCLQYMRANDPNGANWGGTTRTVHQSNGKYFGIYNSLGVVNGKPAISYFEQTTGAAGRNLKYVRALDENGTTWGQRFTLDAPDNVGSWTSLAVVNCSPAISYYDSTNGNLKYFRSIPVWSGADAASDHWNRDANWGHGCVPLPGDSVLLPANGVTREAVIYEDDVLVTDLTMQTNRTLRISGNRTLTVNGVLTMGGKNITVDPGSKIVLGCSASVVRAASATNFIVGDVRKEFCSTASFTFPVGEITGTAEYSPLDVVITAGTFPLGDPPSLTVHVTDTWLPGLVQASAVSRYWSVAETGNVIADMTFNYLASDVNTGTGKKVFRQDGLYTVEVTPSVPNPTLPKVNVTGVGKFASDWGIGAVAPPPQCIIVGGRITDRNGNGVPNATVTMVEQNGAVRTYFPTNSKGYYAFVCVTVGQTVTVSVQRQGLVFVPQSFFLTEKFLDLNFTAQ